MEKWLYNNFAAGSFHTKKLCSRLYSTEIEFYKNRFWATLWGLRSNVHTPYIACWKARGRLSIRHNWNFFAICYGWDVISGNLSKSTFSDGGGSLWVQISDWWGVAVGVRKLECHIVSKYPQCIFRFCHKARMCQTDGETDKQNYDSQDRASVAASRGKK